MDVAIHDPTTASWLLGCTTIIAHKPPTNFFLGWGVGGGGLALPSFVAVQVTFHL